MHIISIFNKLCDIIDDKVFSKYFSTLYRGIIIDTNGFVVNLASCNVPPIFA